MGRFSVRVKYFLRCEKRKIFSWFFILIRFVLSFAIAVLVPIAFFITFLFQKPREIEVLNRYLDEKVLKMYPEWECKYSSGKIGINGLKLVYHLDNLNILFHDNSVFFPSIGLRIRMSDVLRNELKIDELIVENLESNIKLESVFPPRAGDRTFLENQQSRDLVQNYIEYLHLEKIIFRSLVFKNSVIHLYGPDDRPIDRFELREGVFHFGKSSSYGRLDIDLELGANDRSSTTRISGGCQISRSRNGVCKFDINNFSPESIGLWSLLEGDGEIGNILGNIRGSFDAKISVNFSDHLTLESSSFTIDSSSGSFNLRQFFGGEIPYRNVTLAGETRGMNYLAIRNLRATLLLDRTIDFAMLFEVEDRKRMKIDIDIANASVKDVGILWPIFLSDFGIRSWVLEHMKDGHIPKTKAYMNFDYRGGRFELMEIDSDILFRNAKLDYHSDFPAISNTDARAVFTIDNMNIYVDRALMADGTALRNGLVQLDFNDEKSMLKISAETLGKAYEAMYFIDNEDRGKVKDITSKYANGLASLDIGVKIPLANDTIALEDVFLEVRGAVRGNSTYFLTVGSDFELHILKEFGSNVFRTKLNLKDSAMDFSTIDFIKGRGQQLDISLEIVDSDSGRILLDNILVSGDLLNINGDGVIDNGKFTGLWLEKVRYGENSFNIIYRIDKNSRVNVRLEGDSMCFNRKLTKKDLDSYLDQYLATGKNSNSDFPLGNAEYSLSLKELLINGEYRLKNLALSALVENGGIRHLRAKIQRNNSETTSFDVSRVDESTGDIKYNIVAECSNFGELLSELNISNNLIYGDLKIEAVLDRNNILTGEIGLRNGFNYLMEKTEQKNTKFFNHIMNNSEVPESLKNTVKNQSTIGFSKLEAKFKLADGLVTISDCLLSTDDVLGIGMSGKGDMDIGSGRIKFSGLMVPLEKINTMFGLNRIPLVGDLIFGSKGGGLMAIGYEFSRANFNSDYNLRIIPSTIIDPFSLKNFLLIFLLL